MLLVFHRELNEQVLLRMYWEPQQASCPVRAVFFLCVYVCSIILSMWHQTAVLESDFCKKRKEQCLLKYHKVWEFTVKKGIRSIS